METSYDALRKRYADRDREIWNARKRGSKVKDLAKEHGVSTARIAGICIEQSFIEQEPEIANGCSQRERPSAAFLWSRGYTVIPPKR